MQNYFPLFKLHSWLFCFPGMHFLSVLVSVSVRFPTAVLSFFFFSSFLSRHCHLLRNAAEARCSAKEWAKVTIIERSVNSMRLLMCDSVALSTHTGKIQETQLLHKAPCVGLPHVMCVVWKLSSTRTEISQRQHSCVHVSILSHSDNYRPAARGHGDAASIGRTEDITSVDVVGLCVCVCVV